MGERSTNVFTSILVFIVVASGLIKFWHWIGSHFADAPAQAVWGMSPIAVGMIIFFLVILPVAAVLEIIGWIINGD